LTQGPPGWNDIERKNELMDSKVMNVVIDTLKGFNAELQNEVLANPTLETSLYGLNGNLDSLGLVSLIADLEQRINDEFSTDLILADERAMSARNSPFRNVGSLAEYIEKLLAAEPENG
jgi:acyl carrier protein